MSAMATTGQGMERGQECQSPKTGSVEPGSYSSQPSSPQALIPKTSLYLSCQLKQGVGFLEAAV